MKKRILSVLTAFAIVFSTFVIAMPIQNKHVQAAEYIEGTNQWTLPTDWTTGLAQDEKGWDLTKMGQWEFGPFNDLNTETSVRRTASSKKPSEAAKDEQSAGPGPYINSTVNESALQANAGYVASSTGWYVNNNKRWGAEIFKPATFEGATVIRVNPYDNPIGIVFVAPSDGLYAYSELVEATKFVFEEKAIIMTATVRKNGAIQNIFVADANNAEGNLTGTIALKASESLVFGFENAGAEITEAKEKALGGFDFYLKGLVIKKVGEYSDALNGEKSWNLPTDWSVTDKKNAGEYPLPIKGNWELRSYPKNAKSDAFLGAPIGVNNTETATGSPEPWLTDNYQPTTWYLNHNGKFSEAGGAFKCSTRSSAPQIAVNVFNGALGAVFTAPEDGEYAYYELLNSCNFKVVNGTLISTVATVRKVTADGQYILDSFTSSSTAPSSGVNEGTVVLKKGEQLLFGFDNARNTYVTMSNSSGDSDYDWMGFYVPTLNVRKVGEIYDNYKEIDHTPVFAGDSNVSTSGNVKLMGIKLDGSYFDPVMTYNTDGTVWFANDPEARNDDANYKFLWKGTPDGKITGTGGSHLSTNGSVIEFTAPNAGTYNFYVDIGKSWSQSNTVYSIYQIVKEDGTVLCENTNYQEDGLIANERHKTLSATVVLAKGEKVYITDVPDTDNTAANNVNSSTNGPFNFKITEIKPNGYVEGTNMWTLPTDIIAADGFAKGQFALWSVDMATGDKINNFEPDAGKTYCNLLVGTSGRRGWGTFTKRAEGGITVNPDDKRASVVEFTAPVDGVYYYEVPVSSFGLNANSTMNKQVVFSVVKDGVVYNITQPKYNENYSGTLTGTFELKADETIMFAAEQYVYIAALPNADWPAWVGASFNNINLKLVDDHSGNTHEYKSYDFTGADLVFTQEGANYTTDEHFAIGILDYANKQKLDTTYGQFKFYNGSTLGMAGFIDDVGYTVSAFWTPSGTLMFGPFGTNNTDKNKAAYISFTAPEDGQYNFSGYMNQDWTYNASYQYNYSAIYEILDSDMNVVFSSSTANTYTGANIYQCTYSRIAGSVYLKASETAYFVIRVAPEANSWSGDAFCPNVKELTVTLVPHQCVETLTYVEEVRATCTATGTAAHWECGCGSCYKDEAATEAITPEELVITAPIYHPDEEGSWTTDEDSHSFDRTCCDITDVADEPHDWSNNNGICAECLYECAHAEYANGACTNCGVSCTHDGEDTHFEDTLEGTHNEVYDDCGAVKTENLEHDWSNKDGICAADGCDALCTHGDGESIIPGTCVTKSYCSDCGYEWETDPENHVDVEGTYTPIDENYHSFDRTCCDDSDIASEEHVWGDDNACDLCTYTCSNHVWGDDEFCDNCGTECLHTDGNASEAHCQGAAVCATCGQEYGDIDENAHTEESEFYNDLDTGKHGKKFPCCGAIDAAYEQEDHDWSNKDGVCADGCGMVCGHEGTKIPGNCITPEYCGICGQVWEIDPDAHAGTSTYYYSDPETGKHGTKYDCCDAITSDPQERHEWSNESGDCVLCHETIPGFVVFHHALQLSLDMTTYREFFIGALNMADGSICAVETEPTATWSPDWPGNWIVGSSRDEEGIFYNVTQRTEGNTDYVVFDMYPTTNNSHSSLVGFTAPAAGTFTVFAEFEKNGARWADITLMKNDGTILDQEKFVEAGDHVVITAEDVALIEGEQLLIVVSRSEGETSGGNYNTGFMCFFVEGMYESCPHGVWENGICVYCENACDHEETSTEADCQNKAICAFCGKTFGTVNNYNHAGEQIINVTMNDEYYHYWVWSCHTDAVIRPETHTYYDGVCACGAECQHMNFSPANCIEPMHCLDCQQNIGEIDPDNHVLEESSYSDNGDGTHDKFWNCCRAVVIDDEEHSYVGGECVCGYPEPDTPVTEAPETNAPETNAPETEAPETNAPETNAPETEAPETEAPETEAPETEAPETEAPETEAPETEAPETGAPETEAPETEAPETEIPDTEAPVIE